MPFLGLAQRQIQVTINGFPLGQVTGTAGVTRGNLGPLSGLRTQVHIVNSGGPAFAQATVRIWGLTIDHMNQFSTLGMVGRGLNLGTVLIEARDRPTDAFSLVFTGQLDLAVSDFQGSADLPFHIEAHSGAFQSLQNVAPMTLPGPTPAVALLSQVASGAGMTVDATGVIGSPTITDPYYDKSPMTQLASIAEHAGLHWATDSGQTFVVWSDGGVRSGGATISPTTGMVGYPSYSSLGVKFKTLWNPALRYASTVTVFGTKITPALGTWQIFILTHDLESYKPNGQWFTTIECRRPSVLGTQ